MKPPTNEERARACVDAVRRNMTWDEDVETIATLLDEREAAVRREEREACARIVDHLSSENASLANQVESMAMRIESLAGELAKPEDVRLREVLDALDGRAVIFDGLGARVRHLLDEMDEWIERAGAAERRLKIGGDQTSGREPSAGASAGTAETRFGASTPAGEPEEAGTSIEPFPDEVTQAFLNGRELGREEARTDKAKDWTARGRCASLLRSTGWVDSDPGFAERVEALYSVLEGRAEGRESDRDPVLEAKATTDVRVSVQVAEYNALRAIHDAARDVILLVRNVDFADANVPSRIIRNLRDAVYSMPPRPHDEPEDPSSTALSSGEGEKL